MHFSDLPFSRLRALLLDLGFAARVIDGKYLGFYHPASDTLFTFRRYGAKDKVSLVDLVMVRKQLDWRGVLTEDAFEASLRKASA